VCRRRSEGLARRDGHVCEVGTGFGGKRASNGEGRKNEPGGTSVLKGEGEGGT
jgi:hypothetical protein